MVAGAEQDQVREVGWAAVSAGVRWCASRLRVAVQPGYWQWPPVRLWSARRSGVGGAASNARVHEITVLELDREPAGVACESRGGLDADRPGAFEHRRLIVARCRISVVGLRRGPPSSAESPPCRASVTARRGGLLPLEDRAGRCRRRVASWRGRGWPAGRRRHAEAVAVPLKTSWLTPCLQVIRNARRALRPSRKRAFGETIAAPASEM